MKAIGSRGECRLNGCREETPVEEAVVATLRKMGFGTDAEALTRTVLIRDVRFLGVKFRFDGGYAVWLAEKNVIEVYDDAGKLLKAVGIEKTDDEQRAA